MLSKPLETRMVYETAIGKANCKESNKNPFDIIEKVASEIKSLFGKDYGKYSDEYYTKVLFASMYPGRYFREKEMSEIAHENDMKYQLRSYFKKVLPDDEEKCRAISDFLISKGVNGVKDSAWKVLNRY